MAEDHEQCGAHSDMMVQMARGAEHFKQIKTAMSEILVCVKEVKTKQSEFERRMFIDNGQPCIQTRLIHLEAHKIENEKRSRKHEALLKVVFAMLIGILGKFLYSEISGGSF